MRRHEVTDRQWEVTVPLLSGKPTDCGVTAKDNRSFVNAVVWIMRTGYPWADLPECFGFSNTVCKRFRRLAQKGVWVRLFESLQAPELGVGHARLDRGAGAPAFGKPKKGMLKPSASGAAAVVSAPKSTPVSKPWATLYA